MNCIEFLGPSRCKRGIPVAHLFRHYFCEGDHKGCPFKGMEKVMKGGLRNRFECQRGFVEHLSLPLSDY